MAALSKVQSTVLLRFRPRLIHSLLGLLSQALKTSIFKKTKKVYIYTYLYFVLPRVWNRVAHYFKAKKARRRPEKDKNKQLVEVESRELWKKIFLVLVTGMKWDQLPFFLVSLILGYNGLKCLMKSAVQQQWNKNKIISRFPPSLINLISAYVASWAAFKMYSRKIIISNTDTSILSDSTTSDMTILLLVRALDTLINLLTGKHLRKQKGGILAQVFDPLLFTGSCAIIMTSWFYYPEKLPQSYHKWITMASTTDEKLVHLLREIHFGRLLFNRVPENQANIETLRSLYEKFQISYPDPLLFKSQPEHEHESAPVNNSGTVMPYVNCRLVHRNVTSNCEIHALWRLVTGFEYAFMIYLPLNCVLSLKTIIPLIQNRKSGKSPLTARNLFQFLKPILISSTRSSVFLSSFIVIIYYTICVSRNYLPLILKGIYLLNEKSPKDHDYHHDELSWRTRFDKYSPIAGSIFCGLSIFLEPQRKQGELALFVFMKGIYCLLIRERENNTTTDENKGLNYKKKSYYVFPSKNVESLVFSLSFSTLLVLYQRDKALVRGVFNKLIGLCV